MDLTEKPVVEAQMMIRKPVAEVFEAFVNPEITTKFWFTKSSGRLEKNANVIWEWEMYGASTQVYVTEIVQDHKISIRWDEPQTVVDFVFSVRSAEETYVVINNYGFHLTGDELIEAIKDKTGGFTTVLDGMKAYLEHGLELKLIWDKFLSAWQTSDRTKSREE